MSDTGPSDNRAALEAGKQAAASNPELGRKLGLVAVIALGVGSAVGSGIFSTLSQVAQVAGSSLLLVLAYLLGSLLQIPGSLCIAELGSAYPVDGGQYIYFREAGSKKLAFLCGWVCFLATDGPSVAIMTLAVVNYMSFLIPVAPNWLLRLVAICFVIFFMILHTVTVKGGGFFQTVITFIKILPFVFIIGVGMFYINGDLFLSSQVSSSIAREDSYLFYSMGETLALISAIAVTSFSFDGLFSACYMSGEIKNPTRNIPRGLIVAVIIVMLLYVGLTTVASGLLSVDELAASKAPIALLSSKIPMIGSYAEPVVAVIAIVVILGTISSSIMYMPRMQYAMAKDGYFFKIFGKVHSKYETPYMSILINGTIIIVLTFFGNLEDILNYFTIVVLIKNCASFATILFLRKKKNYHPSYRCPGGMVVPIIACVFSFFLIVVSALEFPLGGLCSSIMILSGLPVYFIWNKQQNNKTTDAENK